RAVFKANVLVSPSIQKNYREQFATLESVANSKFLSVVSASGDEADGTTKQLWAVFAPVPEHDTLVSLHRVEGIPARKRPTFDAFRSSLIEKYGVPTSADAASPALFWWSFDGEGALKPPGFIKDMGYCRGTQQKVDDSQWVLLNVPRIPD